MVEMTEVLKHILMLTEKNSPSDMKFTPEAFMLTLAMIHIGSPELLKEDPSLETFYDHFVIRNNRTSSEKIIEKILDGRVKKLEYSWNPRKKSYDTVVADEYFNLIIDDIKKRHREICEDEESAQKLVIETYELVKEVLWYQPVEHITNMFDELRHENSIKQPNDSDCDEADASGSERCRIQLMKAASKSRDLYKGLSSLVFGQEKAIRTVTEGYFRSELDSIIRAAHGDYGIIPDGPEKRILESIGIGSDYNQDIEPRRTPRNVFLFAGPPGVGKTFLARQIGKLLDRPVRIFDMTRFNETQEGTNAFIGSGSVFVGSQNGEVTGYVSENPTAVIVFDEIEKAHRSVQNLFLQILDGGTIPDNHTKRPVSFVNNIVIFTTNAGKTLYSDPDCEPSTMSRNVIIDALLRDKNASTGAPLLLPEICSRLSNGGIVMFDNINAGALHRIAKDELERLSGRFSLSMSVSTEIDSDVCSALLYSLGGRADARNVSGRAADFFSENIYNISNNLIPKQVRKMKELVFRTEIPEDNDDIRSLFRMSEPLNAVIFGKYTPETNTGRCVFTSEANPDEVLRAASEKRASFIIADLSEGKKAIDLIRRINNTGSNLPIWVIRGEADPETEREIRTLSIAGTLPDPREDENAAEVFLIAADMIAGDIYRDRIMIRLARSNKELSFVCGLDFCKGTVSVTLRGMKLITAVRAEDRDDLLDSEGVPEVRFDDIIGAKDAKDELKLFANFLREPAKFVHAKLPMPKGVILYGPPGTGKTMLAKAMAAEAGVPFIPTEGNRFMKKYVGEGAGRVHEVFARARRYAPCVLFVDEVDSIASDRTSDENKSRDVLNAFLTEMNGFRDMTEKPVFVLCTTNSDAAQGSSMLDDAFLRRFDNRIFVGLPDRDERRLFMKRRADANSAFSVSPKRLDSIADRSVGMSLDNLDSVFSLALRTAVRLGKLEVSDEIMDKAFEEYKNGGENDVDTAMLKQTACHEAGHAIVSKLVGNTPSYITIVSRGDFGGYMQRETDEKKRVLTRQQLLDRICTSLAGRAAEIVSFGNDAGVNTGASSDISNAVSVARSMVCNYGMDAELGMAVICGGTSGELEMRINSTINRILTEQLERATELLTTNKAVLDKVAAALLRKNSLTGADFDRIFAKTCTPK